jgi:hypothetical protein
MLDQPARDLNSLDLTCMSTLSYARETGWREGGDHGIRVNYLKTQGAWGINRRRSTELDSPINGEPKVNKGSRTIRFGAFEADLLSGEVRKSGSRCGRFTKEAADAEQSKIA